jgi:lysophospholipase L1-like esterase
LLGASLTMGSGVEEEETFGALLEDRLNRENGGTGPDKYEVLNFGVAGYGSLHMLYQLRHKVLQFEPNAVLYTGNAIDKDRNARLFTRMISRGILPSEPYLQELARRSGVHAETGPTEARRRMAPYERELLAWVYSKVVADCREHGIEPIYMYLPSVIEATEPWQAERRREALELAERAGFRMIDLTDVYEPHKPSDLWILENDTHPNARGHQLIADRLHTLLRETDAIPSVQ